MDFNTMIGWAIVIFLLCLVICFLCRAISGIVHGITFCVTRFSAKHSARREKQEAIRKQQELVDRYASGALLREVLTYISDGGQLPHEIRIYHDRIEGVRAGKTTVYNFAEHRVHNLKEAFSPGAAMEELIQKPQMAMAEAINRLMGGKYEVFDQAERNVTVISSTCNHVTYRAKSVLMKLKSTMPNRSF